MPATFSFSFGDFADRILGKPKTLLAAAALVAMADAPRKRRRVVRFELRMLCPRPREFADAFFARLMTTNREAPRLASAVLELMSSGISIMTIVRWDRSASPVVRRAGRWSAPTRCAARAPRGSCRPGR